MFGVGYKESGKASNVLKGCDNSSTEKDVWTGVQEDNAIKHPWNVFFQKVFRRTFDFDSKQIFIEYPQAPYNYPSQLDEKLKDTMSTTRNTIAGGSASVECRLFNVKKLNTALEMGMKKYPVSLKDSDLAKISENLWINWALSYLKTPVVIPQYLDVINPISSGLNGDKRFAATAEFIKNKSQLNNFVMNILKNKDIKYFDNKPWQDKNLFLSGGRLFQNQIHSY